MKFEVKDMGFEGSMSLNPNLRCSLLTDDRGTTQERDEVCLKPCSC